MANELDGWIRNEIAPTLRDHGFRGGPRRFRRRSSGFVAGIQFQSSSGNVFGTWRFTINFGVQHERLAKMEGSERPDGWHVARRVSGKRGADVWWDVGVGNDPVIVAGQVRDTLRRDVLPFLDLASTPEGFRSCVAALPKPWGDELLRQVDVTEAYDPTTDARSPAERRLELMTTDPRTQELFAQHPELGGFLEAAALGPEDAMRWAKANPEAVKALACPPREP